MKALFEANNSEYGYRRIHAALVRGGESVDDETVRKIMRGPGPGAVPAEALAFFADSSRTASQAHSQLGEP